MPVIKPFQKIHSDDEDQNRFQSNVHAAFQQLENKPLLGSVIIPAVSFVSSSLNLIPHLLGTKWQSYIVTNCNTQGVQFFTPRGTEGSSANPRPAFLLPISASADCIADVIVF